MHALLVLASTEGEETSKAFFYIAGLALAGWAVVLSAIGLTRPSFPGSDGAARGVMAISTVLVILAVTAAVVTG